jgi:hypothetical protein
MITVVVEITSEKDALSDGSIRGAPFGGVFGTSMVWMVV